MPETTSQPSRHIQLHPPAESRQPGALFRSPSPRRRLRLAAAAVVTAALGVGSAAAQAPPGPLKVHPDNRRYLKAPGSDRAIYLAGSHHRRNLQDVGACPTPAPFPFSSTYPASLGHNFIRGWHWEHAKWLRVPPAPGGNECIAPSPFARDKFGKFDLSGVDATYLNRLLGRAQAAANRGRYLSVMLFQGFSVEGIDPGEDPFTHHPFRAPNNVEGIDGDWLQPDPGNNYPDLSELHVLAGKGTPPRPSDLIVAQEGYINDVVGALSNAGNILWEVSNESNRHSLGWQEWVLQQIRDAEAGLPPSQRHLVWLSHPRRVDNDPLFSTAADIISPSANNPAVRADGSTTDGAAYRFNPPATSGKKVVILDTDHMRPQCNSTPQWCGDEWPWKALTRGYHIALLDDFGNAGPHPDMRRAIADTVSYANRVSLVDMAPQNEDNAFPSSTRYALFTAADPDPTSPYQQPPADGREYLVFKPDGGTTITLQNVPAGDYRREWFRVSTGATQIAQSVFHPGGAWNLNRPAGWGTGPAVVWLKRLIPDLEVEVGGQVRGRGSTVPFGATEVGQPVSRTFTLRNTGSDPLHVAEVRLTGGTDFSLIDPSPFTVGPGSSRNLTVTLDADAPCSCTAVLEIDSDDPAGLYALNLAGTVSPAAGTCVSSSTTLCLHDDRFEVTLQYVDHHNGGTGPGKAIGFSDRTGLFWFFNQANVEVMVKVLGPLDGYWWVFHGGMTDLSYNFIVRDTMTGNEASYIKAQGSYCGGADTSALPDGSPASSPPPAPFRSGTVAAFPAPGLTPRSGSCTPNSTRLCLLGGRFAVEVDFDDPGTGATLAAEVDPYNDRTGFFSFFNPNNLEVPVKMVDATSLPNGHFWVFYGSLTNVDHTVRVTDTATGAQQTYPSGDPFCGGSDTAAFPP